MPDDVTQVGFQMPSTTRREVRSLLRAWYALYLAQGKAVEAEYLEFEAWVKEVLAASSFDQAFADKELKKWKERYKRAFEASKGKTGKAPKPENPDPPGIDWNALASAVAVVAVAGAVIMLSRK